MKARSGFIKAKLGEQVYVIPYGQNIVDYCDSMLLNETGEILWDGLEQHSTSCLLYTSPSPRDR